MSGRERLLKPSHGVSLLDDVELRHHWCRHFLARLLVTGLEFGPTLRETAIPDDRAEIRLKMLQHEPQCLGESKDRVRRLAAGIGKMEDGEVRSVNVIVAVNQEKFHKNWEQDLLDCQDGKWNVQQPFPESSSSL